MFSDNFDQSSVLSDYFSNFCGKLFPYFLKVRLYFAKIFEKSILVNILENTFLRLMVMQMRTIGIFLMSFGAISLGIGLYQNSDGPFVSLTTFDSIISLLVLFISFLLISSKHSVGFCLSISKLFPFFKFNIRIYADAYKNKDLSVQYYSQSFFVGLIFGLISAVVPATNILLFLLSFVFVIICFNLPESGVLCAIFVIPFSSGNLISFICVITLVSFIFKFLRGKRHISLNVINVLLLLFVFLLISSYPFSKEFHYFFEFLKTKVTPFILAFLILNIVRSTDLAKRCFIMLFSSSVITVILTIIQYVFLLYKNTTFTEIISDIDFGSYLSDNIISTSSLQMYLLLILPIVFTMMLFRRSISQKFSYSLQFFFIVFLFVYNYDILVLNATLICVISFMFFKQKFYAILFLFVPLLSKAIGFLAAFMNKSIPFSTVTTIAQSTISASPDFDYLFLGHGFDNYSFINDSVYSNVFQRMLYSVGLIGLILIISMIYFYLKKNICFIYPNKKTDAEIKHMCIGTLISAISFCYISSCRDILVDTHLEILICVILSLGISSIESSENDFIDDTTVREHHICCGTN